MSNPACSIVVSVYNEEAVLNLFYKHITEILDKETDAFEIIFVNDGSQDRSLQILTEIAHSDSRVKVINFSRNFGHEAAMLAGIDYSKGDAVICMDSDLQHPPVLIPEMLAKCKEGYDVINMVRKERKDAGFFKRVTSKLFYKFINMISPVKLVPNASDFFLISRPVADLIKNDYQERTRFLRGLIQIVGFNNTTMDYVAPERAAGQSHYSLIKLMRLSSSAVASFSKTPLKIGLYLGLTFGFLSALLIIYSIVMWIVDKPVSGYTTLIIFLSAFAGIQLTVTGLIGYYIGLIFDEIKKRPIFVIQNIISNE